jgi:multidrug transporter EmrE-like cation transporter
MSLVIFLIIIFEIFLNVAAQLALKAGIDRIGHFDFSWSNFIPILTQILISPWFWLGIGIYVVSVVVWLMILSRIEVSIAYPLTSMGYILSAVAAYYLFGEHVSMIRIAGILVILLGVVLVARS